MIVVGVEVSSLWHIKTERWVVVISSKQVVWIVDETWVVGSSLGEIWRPDTKVSILGLMDSHVWWPHSIMDHSLSEVPLLEEITSVLLMSWVNLWEVDHLLHELVLFETLVHQEIVLLMHGSVATPMRAEALPRWPRNGTNATYRVLPTCYQARASVPKEWVDCHTLVSSEGKLTIIEPQFGPSNTR